MRKGQGHVGSTPTTSTSFLSPCGKNLPGFALSEAGFFLLRRHSRLGWAGEFSSDVTRKPLTVGGAMIPRFSLLERLLALCTTLTAVSALEAQVATPAPFVPNDPYFAPNLSLAYSGQWYLRNLAPAQMTLSYTLGGQPVSIPAKNDAAWSVPAI